MTPQLELALRLMDEIKLGKKVSTGGGSEIGSPVGGDEEDEEDEEDEYEEDEDDLESVDEYAYGGYGGFPIAGAPGLNNPSTREEGGEEAKDNTDDDPYADYRPEPGLGRVRKWLDGLRVGEMVA
jgi:hypothetical protein